MTCQSVVGPEDVHERFHTTATAEDAAQMERRSPEAAQKDCQRSPERLWGTQATTRQPDCRRDSGAQVVGITQVVVYALSSRCSVAFSSYCVGGHWNGDMGRPLTDERSNQSVARAWCSAWLRLPWERVQTNLTRI